MSTKTTKNRQGQGFQNFLIFAVLSAGLLSVSGYSQVASDPDFRNAGAVARTPLNRTGNDRNNPESDHKLSMQVAGRMVFSKNPIDPAAPSGLTDRFSAGESIYSAILLNGSLKDFVTDQYVRDSNRGISVTRPGIEVDFQIDGQPLFDGSTRFVFQIENKEGAMEAVPGENFLIFDISPTVSNARTYKYAKLHFPMLSAVGRPNNKAKAGAQYYSFHLGKLSPGEHTLSFTVTGKSRIVGSFTITGSNYGYYSSIANELDSAAAANFQLPKSAWNNPAVERSVVSAFRLLPGERVVKTILVSPDWFVQRDQLGLIIHRGLFAVVITRTADGKCYFQREYFKQLHRGGAYGPTVQDGKSETRELTSCPTSSP